jgi:hypothetical protein
MFNLYRQYLDYFKIDGQDAGGGVGTTTAIIFGIVSNLVLNCYIIA